MKLLRNCMLSLLSLSGLALITGQTAQAQNYPNAPIKWIVPYSAGGATDNVTRILAQAVSEDLGRSVVVENRPGAATVLGAEQLKRSTPNGYTIMTADDATLSINPALYEKLSYDPAKDFTFISTIVRVPLLLAISSSLPVNNVKDLIAYARKNPGKLDYASPGTGSPHHIAMEVLMDQTGIQMQHIPYKGSAPALNDLLSGQVKLMFLTLNAAVPNIQTGKIRVLGVAGPSRLAVAPNIPTLSEEGLPGFDFSSWQGVVAPAGTPQDVVVKLNQSLNRVLTSKSLKEQLERLGLEPIASTPEAFAQQSALQAKQMYALIKAKGIKVD